MPRAYQLSHHVLVDDQIAPFRSRKIVRPPTVRQHLEHKHFVVEERTLSYACQSHTHPFVPALMDRLLDRSVPGLEGADTEYETKATLLDATQAKTGELAAFVVQAGEDVRLPDGMRFLMPDSTEARFAADRTLAVADGREVPISPGAELRLTPGSKLIRADRSVVTLVTLTRVAVTDGKPQLALFRQVFTPSSYAPSSLVVQPYPVDELDFSTSGSYSVYNWELFYHVPLTVGMHLSKNQRFDEAQRWFHYVFDPTDNSDGPTPERYWKARPLRTTDVEMAEEIILELSTLGDGDPRKDDLLAALTSWKDSPFRPHLVARHRHSAFMFKAVFAYLDNLIDWGDTLFRQDSPESVDEALQLYILAANILGRRPQEVPKKGGVRAQTYAEFKSGNAVSAFGNVLRDIEAELPLDIAALPSSGGDIADADRFATLRTLGASLYFCVPRNDKLIGYWNTVADRLFKIRNSLNIQGVFRQLPLFEPPIDPALLARAAAAGLDVAAAVGSINLPLPPVRFGFLIQKAAEICQEVKSLGAALLAAMEKEDNEALSILRAKHERVILGLTETVRYAQWQDAIKAREGIESSIAATAARYVYYERLLGKQDTEITIPALDALDLAALDRKKLKATEPQVARRPIEIDIAQDVDGVAGGRMVSTHEVEELELLELARSQYSAAAGMEIGAAALGLIPHFGGEAEPMGAGASLRFGGEELAKMLSLMALSTRTSGDKNTYEASKSAKIGGYARREQEWAFQSNLAANEITQTLKQLRGVQIREAIAERELKNHQQQMKNADEVERFLSDERKGKKTSQGLYTWIKRETRGLYSQCFQLAYDVAKKAERALQYELGDDAISFLTFGYAAGREGLLAGEKLHLDVKRMEMTYHELNTREYELTKHVSLLQLAPEELLRLRRTGACRLTIPEELFDLDCAGHYFRRIRSVAVSIPCVVGPYASVNCTLTLEKGRFRSDPDVADYPNGTFVEISQTQSIVTSSAQNDAGMFETNLRDERYLPFEGYGVESTWSLRLPGSDGSFRQFDYNSIADVVLHIRYTAREGGKELHDAAEQHFGEYVAAGGAAGTVRLFSMRHDFPSEWSKFKSLKSDTGEQPSVDITLRAEHFPFWSTGKLGSLGLSAAITDGKISGALTLKSDDDEEIVSDAFAVDKSLGGLYRASFSNKSLTKPKKLTMTLPTNQVENVWLAMSWGKA